jgi:hypothetical protein
VHPVGGGPKATPALPRITLLDNEYLRVVTAAELDWVRNIAKELADGRLTWSFEELAALAAAQEPPADSMG